MNESNKEEIGFLIELAITGQADARQFEEVMTRVENEPEVGELYRQALAEHRLFEGQVPVAEKTLEQERVQQQAEQQRRQQENNLDLGM